jgi:hypothetical protein
LKIQKREEKEEELYSRYKKVCKCQQPNLTRSPILDLPLPLAPGKLSHKPKA